MADPDTMAESDPRREAFWYRRTFTLKESLPDVAKLKIGKAMFGTRVCLNGKLLGDHAHQPYQQFPGNSALRLLLGVEIGGNNSSIILARIA